MLERDVCWCNVRPRMNLQHSVIYRLPGTARCTMVKHVRECSIIAEVNDSIQNPKQLSPTIVLYWVTLSRQEGRCLCLECSGTLVSASDEFIRHSFP